MHLNCIKLRMTAGRRRNETFFQVRSRSPCCLLTVKNCPSHETAPDDGHAQSIAALVQKWRNDLEENRERRMLHEAAFTMQINIEHNFHAWEDDNRPLGLTMMKDLAREIQQNFKPPETTHLRIKFTKHDNMDPGDSDRLIQQLGENGMNVLNPQICTEPALDHFYPGNPNSPMMPMTVNPNPTCKSPVVPRLSFVSLDIDMFCNYINRC